MTSRKVSVAKILERLRRKMWSGDPTDVRGNSFSHIGISKEIIDSVPAEEAPFVYRKVISFLKECGLPSEEGTDVLLFRPFANFEFGVQRQTARLLFLDLAILAAKEERV